MDKKGIRYVLARRWRLGLLALVAVGAVAGVIAVVAGRGGPAAGEESQGEASLAGRDLLTVQRQAVTMEVPLEGKLVFPRTAELSFDVAGKLGEILAAPGQRVQQGQALARLDATSTAALETALAAANLKLDKAQDSLEAASERFADTPVEKAQFEQDIANARLSLENAQDELADFLTDHGTALAEAQWNWADAKVALDLAQDDLKDFQGDHNQEFAFAEFIQADAQVALDKAEDALEDFEVDYQKELTAARRASADAKVAFTAAEDAYTDAVRPIGTTQVLDEDALDLLTRRRAAVDAARATQAKADEDLARLEPGPDPLKRQRLEAAVVVAKENLSKAQRQITRVGASPKEVKLQWLEAGVALARSSLDKAQAELDRKAAGPDAAELAAKQKKVDTFQKKLDELLNGPDNLEVALRQAEAAHAKAAVADAQEDLEGAFIRAPYPGVVALVNGEIDDLVTKESRVLTVVDPRRVQIAGQLGAADLRLVEPGDRARVVIAAMAGQTFDGLVTSVSAEPRTERGVITYGVVIDVTVPQGVEVPVTPTGVEVVVLHGVKEALAVPRRAVHRVQRQSVVSVLNDQGLVEERPVVLGDGNQEWVTVHQGLTEGDRVVLPKAAAPPGGEKGT